MLRRSFAFSAPKKVAMSSAASVTPTVSLDGACVVLPSVASTHAKNAPPVTASLPVAWLLDNCLARKHATGQPTTNPFSERSNDNLKVESAALVASDGISSSAAADPTLQNLEVTFTDGQKATVPMAAIEAFYFNKNQPPQMRVPPSLTDVFKTHRVNVEPCTRHVQCDVPAALTDAALLMKKGTAEHYEDSKRLAHDGVGCRKEEDAVAKLSATDWHVSRSTPQEGSMNIADSVIAKLAAVDAPPAESAQDSPEMSGYLEKIAGILSTSHVGNVNLEIIKGQIKVFAGLTVEFSALPSARRRLFEYVLAGATFPAAEPPHLLEVLAACATRLGGVACFSSDGFKSSFLRRHVSNAVAGSDVRCPPIAAAVLNENVSHLIGGVSGSGKTMALLGLGRALITTLPDGKDTQTVFPVPFLAAEVFPRGSCNSTVEESIAIWERINASSKKRNDDVFGQLVAMVTETVLRVVERRHGAATLAALREYGGDPTITFVLGMDEAGRTQGLVKAMAALTGADVKTCLGFAKNSKVRFLLVACGTGVGGDGIAWGSAGSSFEVHMLDEAYALAPCVSPALANAPEEKRAASPVGSGGVPTFNQRIFENYLGAGCPFDVAPILPIVRSNARMAAVCGNLLRTYADDEFGKSASVSLHSFDVRSILPLASLRFKNLNGLAKLGEQNVAYYCVAALRWHLFPFLHMDEGSRGLLITKYGVLLDKGRLFDKRAPPLKDENFTLLCEGTEEALYSPVTGRYELPLFAVTMLANISNMPLLARSANAGDSLEKHWLCASALAAAAAGAPAMFTALLDVGRVAPLAVCPSALLALAESTPSLSCAFAVHDLQEEGVRCGLEAFAQQVAPRLRVRSLEKPQEEPACELAAFRCPPMLLFADTILFYNDTLYLFQAKDRAGEACHWEKTTLQSEYEKMGGTLEIDAAPACGSEVAQTPQQQCLEHLKAAWELATAIRVTSTVFCFVTTTKHTFSADNDDGVLAALRSRCKFVTAGDISFLPFDTQRHRCDGPVVAQLADPTRCAERLFAVTRILQ